MKNLRHFGLIALLCLGLSPAYAGSSACIGIAVELTPQGLVRVNDVLPGTPAAQAAMQVGDVIQAVQSSPSATVVSVQGKSLDQIVDLIRGPLGEAETLVIQRGDQELTLTMTRAMIAH